MTIAVTLSHCQPNADEWLRAELYTVSLEGHVNEHPYQSRQIPPGVTEILHLHRGNVLVVRELHATGDADPADGDLRA